MRRPYGYSSWDELFREMEELPHLDKLREEAESEDEGGYWFTQDRKNELLIFTSTKGKQRSFPKELFLKMKAASDSSRCLKCGGEIGFYVDLDEPDFIVLSCMKCSAKYNFSDGLLYLYCF